MKKMGENGTGNAAGDGWFKIVHTLLPVLLLLLRPQEADGALQWEDGVVDGSFCTDRLIKNDGKMTLKIPQYLQGCVYLFLFAMIH